MSGPYAKRPFTAESLNSPAYYLGQILWKITRTLLMVCLTFVIIYPLLYMASMAFRPTSDVINPQVIWVPNSFTLDNLLFTVKSIRYFKLLYNTSLLSVGSTLIQLIVCSLAGYGLGRFRFWGRRAALVVLVLTIVVPGQLVSLPTYLNFQSLDFFGVIKQITGAPSPVNLLDKPVSFFILALFGQGIRSGLYILIFMQSYRAMPIELEQAALVDGAGFWRTFIRVMMPNTGTVSVIVVLFSLVWYWNDYYMTAIYLRSYRTLSIVLANLRPAFESAGSAGLATDAYQMVVMEQSACILTILPLLILYIFTQKYFTESIEKTGIVG